MYHPMLRALLNLCNKKPSILIVLIKLMIHLRLIRTLLLMKKLSIQTTGSINGHVRKYLLENLNATIQIDPQ